MNKYEINFCNNIIERVSRKVLIQIDKALAGNKVKQEDLMWELNNFDISQFEFINKIDFGIVIEELQKINIDMKIDKFKFHLSILINMNNFYSDIINQSSIRDKLENIKYIEDQEYINFWREFDDYDKEYFDRIKHKDDNKTNI